jgi:hypothetical protein
MQLRHRLACSLAATACTMLTGLGAGPATASATTGGPRHVTAHHGQLPPATERLLHHVRHELRRYRDVGAALRAGYGLASECTADPKYGGMGFHFENRRYVEDGVLDPMRPELLVYRPTAAGKLRLGAVEYFQVDADQDLATDRDRPSLFGMPFDGPMLGHSPTMPIHYDLHVWLYYGNPAGLFAMWNPRVGCAGAANTHAHH